jgi:hypothetical protein
VTPTLAQCSAIGLVVAAYLVCVCAELLKSVAIGRRGLIRIKRQSQFLL